MAALPVVSVLTVVSAAVLSGATAGVAAADSPSQALACNAAGTNVPIPASIGEGVLSPNPVNSGAPVSLVANPADVPNGSLTGGTLLNGPDTGLGFEIQFPTALEGLTTPGSTIGFAGSTPLTVTGGTGTPTLNMSGTFVVPATFPTGNVFVSVPGSVTGTITAGSSGTVSVGLPLYTTSTPLSLSLTGVSTSAIPLICTTTAAQTISSATITPTPFISVSPNSCDLVTATTTCSISVSGGNWAASSAVALHWSTGTDTASCTTGTTGALPGTLACAITAGPNETGTAQAPFTDDVIAVGTNGTGAPFTTPGPEGAVLLTPFVSLNTFCVASAAGLTNLTAPTSGLSPENPLTITRGGNGTYPPGVAPSVGCDPKQQIDVSVMGSNLYIWESATGANPDAAHVGLSPVQLGLDTNSSAEGGNLPPCSPFTGTCTPAVNNGQFDQALGQLNMVTIQDDRGSLTGWTVSGQLEGNFLNQNPKGPPVDNVIPADYLTWDPSIALTTPGSLPANNQNTPGCPDQTPAPAGFPACTGPSGTPAAGNAVGGAPVNGTGPIGVTNDSVPAEAFAGAPETLNNLQGSADVLCATDLSLAGGAAGGGGSFDCGAGLSLAVPPSVAAGDYRSILDITVLGF
jgi:hypothetical protein